MGSVKIAIGIPHAGPLEGYFVDTLLGLSRPADTRVIRVQNKPIDLARNLIAEAVLDDPTVTHLFFMDADMQFHTDALFRLVARGADVVGGIYFSRTEVPIPHAYDFHHEDGPDGDCPEGFEHRGGEYGRWYRPLHKEFLAFSQAHPGYVEEEASAVLPLTDDSLVECDALATGAMLIRREVLEGVKALSPLERHPWFRCHQQSAGGEDFYFCERAKAAGFRVWADFTVQCTHEYRHLFISRDHFEKWAKTYDFDRPLIVDASPGREPLTQPVPAAAG